MLAINTLTRWFSRSSIVAGTVIGCCLPLQAQQLPKGVIADTSFAWEADGIQPDGRWQYGYYATASDASTFTQSTVWRTYYPGPNSWIGAGGEIWDSSGYPRVGKYAVAPSPTRQVVRRWTSNFKGEVTLQIDCQQLQDSLNNQQFRLYRNGVLERTFTKSEASHHLVFIEACQVQVGDELDFLIDSLGNANADWTHLSIRVATESPVDDALIYFPLDETNDLPTGWAAHGPLYDRRSRVADYSGSDHHAVLVNMNRDLASVAGVHGRARIFDGVDDHLLGEQGDVGDGLEEITLSLWMKPQSKEATEAPLSSTGADHVGLGFASVAEAPDARVKFSIKQQGLLGPAGSCPVDEWTHVVGVWKSGECQKLFLNGKKVAQSANPGTGSLDVTDWILGSDRLLAGRFFDGALDEVMVVGRALSDLDVRALYRSRAAFEGVVGDAEYYDGRNDVSVAEPQENGSDELTLAAWITPFTKGNNESAVSSIGNDFFGILYSQYGEGNPIEFRAKGVRLTAPDHSAPTGQWNHVAGVWKSGQIHKLYLNGVEVGNNPSPPSGTIDVEQWIIGRDRQFIDRYFHGLIDGLTVLPEALDAAQVDTLYRQTLDASASGPIEMQGYLRWDYYLTDHGTLSTLTSDPEFYGFDLSSRGYHNGFLDGSMTEKQRNPGSSTHLRGYIEAPDTGEYYFWVSGGTAAALSLSPDDQKYTKQRIARLSPEIGTATGVSVSWLNRWDSFVSQMSAPVTLQAGQRYYIEALQTSPDYGFSQAHTAIAWARPNGVREPIPPAYLYPYVLEEEDGDDDYLPDSWEIQYALDPTDNGRSDTLHQGERGDLDLDGLTNREEYLYGTDPGNSDTDGDGLSDLAEVKTYGTDPSVSDVSPETLVASIPPSSVSGLGTKWIASGESGVVGASFRGEGLWDFSVPSDGFWILQVEGLLRGDLRADEVLPVQIGIDGNEVLRGEMNFRNGDSGTIRILTPYLFSGNHQLSLFADNYTARRTLEILSIKVVTPGGLDADNDGVVDWVGQKLEERSHILPHATFTHSSPAFVEGLASSPNLVDLTYITRSGQSNRVRRFNSQQWDNMLPGFHSRLDSFQTNLQNQMRAGYGRMEGIFAPSAAGPGHFKWFSQLQLQRNEAIGYVAQFENLGIAENRVIVWTPYNVLDGGSLTIPVGSDLLLGAWIQDWDWRTVSLTIDGQVHSFEAVETHVEHFDQAGTYIVSGSHPLGQTNTLTVHVRDAQLQPGLGLGEQRYRTVQFPGIEPDLTLDSDGEIQIGEFLSLGTGAGSEAVLGGLFPGVHRTAARMSETAPILDQEVVHVVGVSDGLRNESDYAIPVGDDLFQVLSPFLVTHLPPGAYVEVTIFAGGVTFPDGTTFKTLTASDFDEHGLIYLEFLVPASRLGAPCHYSKVFDAQGVKIWGSTN